jgi:hypothetical protein
MGAADRTAGGIGRLRHVPPKLSPFASRLGSCDFARVDELDEFAADAGTS